MPRRTSVQSRLSRGSVREIEWKLPLMLPPEVCGCWLCCTLLCASSFVLTEFHMSNMFNIMGPEDLSLTKTYP
ncbi:unnamed protein product, partial [Iphiclides podalirius]